MGFSFCSPSSTSLKRVLRMKGSLQDTINCWENGGWREGGWRGMGERVDVKSEAGWWKRQEVGGQKGDGVVCWW